ncbi:MAG: nucleoside-diphosphate kinase [Lactobacillales bacterium]|nr:nucleoside-diphosphate kinase [Lactobacillales bacterium]
MSIERTFSIVKPDATRRNITGDINAMIESAGLRIVAQKRLYITKMQAEQFYAEHVGKVWFPEFMAYITSGPCVVQVLEGENAIVRYRELMGTTDAAKAAPGTIRHKYGLSIQENTVHGSDSPASAVREISQFFSGIEIVG